MLCKKTLQFKGKLLHFMINGKLTIQLPVVYSLAIKKKKNLQTLKTYETFFWKKNIEYVLQKFEDYFVNSLLEVYNGRGRFTI